jgi:hypothetical protein
MLVSTRYGGDGRCDQCVKLGLKPNLALEEHEELLHAARTLLSEGETNGDIIIPTLAYAADFRSSSDDPDSESVGGSTLATRAKHPPTVSSDSKINPMHPPRASFAPVPIPDLCAAGEGGA